MNNIIILLSFTRLFQALIGLATIRLSTHFLPLEQFGLLGLLMSITTFFGLFFISPIGQYINRHTHEWHQQGILLRKLFKYNWYLIFLTLLSLICTATWYRLHIYPAADWLLIINVSTVVSIMIWAGTWNATLIPLMNMLGKQWQSASLVLLTTLTSLLCSVTLMRFSTQVSTWLAGQIAGLLVGAMIAAYLLRNNLRSKRQIRNNKLISTNEVINYCLPIAASTGLMWFISNGYRFYVDYHWGSRSLAVLIIGFAIAGQFWAIIETIGSQLTHPKYYFELSMNDKQRSRVAFFHMKNALLPSYLLMLFFGISVAPNFIRILTDNRYTDAVEYCQIAMFFEFFRVYTNVQMQAAQIEKNTSFMIIPYFSASIAGVVAILLSVSLFHSLKNLPWIMAFSWLVAAITSFCINMKIFDFKSQIKTQIKPTLSSIAAGIFIYLCSKLLVNNQSLVFQATSISVLGILAITLQYFIQKNNKSFKYMVKIKLSVDKNNE